MHFPSANGGTRTHDPSLTKRLLYQLSYVGKRKVYRQFSNLINIKYPITLNL